MSFLYIILNISINIEFGFLTERIIFLKQLDSLLTNVKLFSQLLSISFHDNSLSFSSSSCHPLKY